ncbi:Clp protease N-terminal domain-containing protein [Kineosporia sp. NBRC 101731]|uniref:Clp protease N-terminal domain-containing protein n=1 Tax=Kineosporia sp. NBRC 101731 TaxID=3032199 RepID=UPI0024A05259|nr:Clp protease N-terminal domain-containing protein [Kineosporia sp. NBRC 101731]GLY29917.1 hypothetical protein Kisp02_32820 [Kineosporia sp. NBRC 101731]
MTTQATDYPADKELRRALSHGHAQGGGMNGVGTNHLLAGLASRERIKEFLAPYDLTLWHVRRAAWSDDDTQPEAGRHEMPELEYLAGKPVYVSDAARAALERCREQASVNTGAGETTGATPVDLLLALLADRECRAVQVLTELAVDIDQLEAGLRRDEVPGRDDPMPPELRPTRDALAGHRRYVPRDLGKFWLSQLVKVLPQNFSGQAVLWVRLEAGDIAERRDGGKARTDDVLLALLTTYTVAQAYPQLLRNSTETFEGARALVAAGLDHDRVRTAMANSSLGDDMVPPRRLLGQDWPRDTSELLERLISEPANRSVRLLRVLGVDPDQLRAS